MARPWAELNRFPRPFKSWIPDGSKAERCGTMKFLATLAGNGLPHLQRSTALLLDRALPLLSRRSVGRPLELLGKVHPHGKRWPAARGFFPAGVLVPHVPGRNFRLAGQMSRMQHGSGAAGKTRGRPAPQWSHEPDAVISLSHSAGRH